MMDNIQGLSSTEAKARVLQYGRNIVEEQKPHLFITLVKKFWSPIPWMLEITIILQLILHKYDEAIIILLLLVFNSVLSFFQENRANNALAMLRKHLAIKARVLRDKQWQLFPAEELVPGDIVHLRMGDIAPADIKLIEGQVLIDQSVLTGEAMPVEGEAGKVTYSGSLIRQGEATGEVIATGKNTYFGKSVELIQSAKSVSHVKNIIFTIIKYLITIDTLLALSVLIYAIINHLSLMDIIPFVLILIVASIPIALPAMFTLSTALGAIQLAKQNVLVTHLTAIEEAATMDVICVDKTGTITLNQLQLSNMKSYPPYTEDELLYYAALASDESSQDPIDQAILFASNARNIPIPHKARLSFTPFDPTIKRTEAIFNLNNHQVRVIKGTPDVLAAMTNHISNIKEAVSELAKDGYRVLSVAADKFYNEQTSHLELIGLIAFNDPPRADSKALLHQLKQNGLHILMVTGDNAATATAVAEKVGLDPHIASATIFQSNKNIDTVDYNVFAGVFPEDKFRLVKELQTKNHIVGMTGDGVNDAPALKQAEVGIAVANATDVAKAAASIVLTKGGLSPIVSAIEISRRIYQRMLTYILNKIIKSLEIAIFLSIGVILTGDIILTPLLIVLLLFANDFMTMSIATDNVPFSRKPDRWQIPHLMMTGGIFSLLILILSFSVFFYARQILHLTLPQLQTLIFVMLVLTGQGIVYLIRERRHFWQSRPARWLIVSSCCDIVIITIMATRGILMAPIKIALIAELFTVIVIYLFFVDFIKVHFFPSWQHEVF